MTDALIVIDMQQGSFGPQTPRHDAAGLVDRLNRLAREVRADGGAVIFVQHDGPAGRPAPSRRARLAPARQPRGAARR
jgi:nicotinamidase-related amidase